MISKETKKLARTRQRKEKKNSIEDNKNSLLLKSYWLPDVFLGRTGSKLKAWEMQSVSTYSTVRCIRYIQIHSYTQVKSATKQ
jgi:hypothetical protein